MEQLFDLDECVELTERAIAQVCVNADEQ